MKKIYLFIILSLVLILFGCKSNEPNKPIDEPNGENGQEEIIDKIDDHENVVNFNEFVKDDNVTEIYVYQKDSQYVIEATKMADYTREKKEFAFVKEEARYVLLTSLGYFSQYVVHMDEECAENLELKVIRSVPEQLKEIYLLTLPTYFSNNYFLFFENALKDEGNNIYRIFINDFIYFVDYRSGKPYIGPNVNKVINAIEKQDKDSVETLLVMKLNLGSSYSDYEIKDGYVYVLTQPDPNAYFSNSTTIILYNTPIVFKDGVVDYSEMSSYTIEEFKFHGRHGNFNIHEYDQDGNETDSHVRIIYKDFDENTTLEEFKAVVRENNLLIRWCKYVDNK